MVALARAGRTCALARLLFLALSTAPGPAATPVVLAQGLRQPILIHTVNPPRPFGGPIQDVGYCELATHPKQYDRAHLRLTALAEYEFEHFMLTDPSCGLSSFDGAIWVGFGGDVPSGAIYCCPGEGRGSATPSKKAKIPLMADGAYRRFRSLMEREGDTTIHATMIGTSRELERRHRSDFHERLRHLVLQLLRSNDRAPDDHARRHRLQRAGWNAEGRRVWAER
jgi:hypothetical protein